MTTGLHFWKMTGAGNDFIVLDARAGLSRPLAQLAATLCPRGTAVGADGLLAVTAVETGRVTFAYHNADGSEARFCGNGARCAARFAVDLGLARSPFRLRFPGLEVEARVAGTTVEIELAMPEEISGALPPLVDRAARPVSAHHVLAGVDHVVVEEHAGERCDLPDLMRQLARAAPGLAGLANVTAFQRQGGELHARTLERGSGETLACGSGALAVALIAAPPGKGDWTTTVVPPARIPLRVTLSPTRGRAVLAGEARVVYRAELDAAMLEGA